MFQCVLSSVFLLMLFLNTIYGYATYTYTHPQLLGIEYLEGVRAQTG